MNTETKAFRIALSIAILWGTLAIVGALIFRKDLISIASSARCESAIGWAEKFTCEQSLDVTFLQLWLEGALSVGLKWVVLPIAILLLSAGYSGRYLRWVDQGRN